MEIFFKLASVKMFKYQRCEAKFSEIIPYLHNSCVASSVAGTRVMCHSVTTPDTKFGAFKLWILLELGPHEIRCSNSKPNQNSGMNTENPQTLSQAPPSQTGTF